MAEAENALRAVEEMGDGVSDIVTDALRTARRIIKAEMASLIDGETILAIGHPQRGQLSADGKRYMRPYANALRKIDAALESLPPRRT